MNSKRWKVIEFDASHYVKAIGFASRNLKDNKYTYTMSGNCYLYATNKYQMHGFYQNDEITIDEMIESNTYNVEDCYKAIIEEDGKKNDISAMVISHCFQEKMALEVKRKIKKIFPNITVSLVETGGIASMYAGQGGIIVAYA